VAKALALSALTLKKTLERVLMSGALVVVFMAVLIR